MTEIDKITADLTARGWQRVSYQQQPQLPYFAIFGVSAANLLITGVSTKSMLDAYHDLIGKNDAAIAALNNNV